jgi:hypothetical protein
MFAHTAQTFFLGAIRWMCARTLRSGFQVFSKTKPRVTLPPAKSDQVFPETSPMSPFWPGQAYRSSSSIIIDPALEELGRGAIGIRMADKYRGQLPASAAVPFEAKR